MTSGTRWRLRRLRAGKVDCVIIDNEPAKAYVAANTKVLKFLTPNLPTRITQSASAKKNPELQKKVNDALNELKAKRFEFQKVVDKYITPKHNPCI